jgi:tetratricopeptide (TPR) repeat protein
LEISNAFDYMLGHFFEAWALLHLGRWGELLRTLREAIGMAEKNGHQLWAMLFRLELAWLHEQAFDFESARQICEQGFQKAKEVQLGYGQLMSRVLLGFAHLGLEHYESAFQCFDEMAHRIKKEHILMDWVWQIPLHLGLSEYYLAQGDFRQSRREAERVCSMAALPGERTWIALGLNALAEIALAEQTWHQAESELSRARTVLEGTQAPLAEWRVLATAARLCERVGRDDDATSYWSRSASLVNRLADSLGNAHPLRQSLLSSPRLPAQLRSAKTQDSQLAITTVPSGKAAFAK